MNMLVALTFLVQAQSLSMPAQRLSERLFYAEPYQRGNISCDRSVAQRQHREFDRRFGARIAALRRKDAERWGADPGFDAIALGSCVRRKSNARIRFKAALRQFAAELSAIEREYP